MGNNYFEKNIKASIIIPTKNREHHIKLCLTNLFKQTISKNEFEVIVIDDGSTDATCKIASNFNGVTVIKNSYSHGPAKARNQGIELAKGEIIIFIDSDILVAPDFIEKHIEYHRNIKDCIVLGARQHLKPNAVNYSNEVLKRESRQVLLELYSFDIEYLSYPWSIAYTCNISIPSAIAKNHPFCSDFNGWGLEDIEWAYRLSLLSLRWVFSNSVTGYHLYHKREMDENKFKQWKKNLDLFQSLHMNEVTKNFSLFENVFNPVYQENYIDVYHKYDKQFANSSAILLDLSCKQDIDSIKIIKETIKLKGYLDCEFIIIDQSSRAKSYNYDIFLASINHKKRIRFFFKESWLRNKDKILGQYKEKNLEVTKVVV